MKALANAKAKMATIHAKHHTRKALQSRLPPTKRFRLDIGDPVSVYREDSKRWEGQYIVKRVEKKVVWIADGNTVKHFIITGVKPFVVGGNDKD